jgi:DNA-binding transcriptional LysR family regulator
MQHGGFAMNITFRQLKIFEAVARHLSFTRASRELHLTQPAVSMQVKQLEHAIGLPLFEQLGKKVFLTEFGQEFRRYAAAISAQLDELDQVVDEMKGLKRGRLTIAVATTANYFVPRLLATFIRRHGDVTVSLEVTNREQLLKGLVENRTDLVIMGQPPGEMDLVAERFMENPLVVVAPPAHPLAQERHIPLQRLREETFLVREQGSGTRSAVERFFSANDMALSTPMEMSSNEAIKQGVEAGLGLGIVSLHTLGMELALRRLVVLDVVKFPIMRYWFIVYRVGKRLSLVAQSFEQFVKEESVNLPGLPEIQPAGKIG